MNLLWHFLCMKFLYLVCDKSLLVHQCGIIGKFHSLILATDVEIYWRRLRTIGVILYLLENEWKKTFYFTYNARDIIVGA